LRRGLVSEAFVTESASARFGAMLSDVPVHLVTDRAAKALSDTVTPAGLVAVCSVPDVGLADVIADGPRLVAVAVAISEPGNAGTLIRIADAMGADAVVLAGHSVDPYNGKCLRASAGSIFSIPVVSDADAASVVGTLSDAGLQVLATTVCQANWRPLLLIGSAYRCLAPPKASTWHRPHRSACTRAPGPTDGNFKAQKRRRNSRHGVTFAA